MGLVGWRGKGEERYLESGRIMKGSEGRQLRVVVVVVPLDHDLREGR